MAQDMTVDKSWYEPHELVYSISTAAQLRGFADLVGGGSYSNESGLESIDFDGKTINLTADIDLTNEYFMGIGYRTALNVFKGTFNGNFHSISNFKTDMGEDFYYAGSPLFLNTEGATIKNLYIVNAEYTVGTGASAGAVVQNAREGTLISHCGVINAKIGAGNGNTGGIVGNLSDSTVVHCFAEVYYVNNIGSNCGIAGGVSGDSIIESCYAFGSALNTRALRGIAPSGNISNCVSLFEALKHAQNSQPYRVGTGSLLNNVGLDITETDHGLVWSFKGLNNNDGADISLAQIADDITIGGRFLASDGWGSKRVVIIQGQNVILPDFTVSEPEPPEPPNPSKEFEMEYLRCGRSNAYEFGVLNEWFPGKMYGYGDYIYDPGERRFFQAQFAHWSESADRPFYDSPKWRVVDERRHDQGVKGLVVSEHPGQIIFQLSRGDVTVTPRWFHGPLCTGSTPPTPPEPPEPPECIPPVIDYFTLSSTNITEWNGSSLTISWSILNTVASAGLYLKVDQYTDVLYKAVGASGTATIPESELQQLISWRDTRNGNLIFVLKAFAPCGNTDRNEELIVEITQCTPPEFVDKEFIYYGSEYSINWDEPYVDIVPLWSDRDFEIVRTHEHPDTGVITQYFSRGCICAQNGSKVNLYWDLNGDYTTVNLYKWVADETSHYGEPRETVLIKTLETTNTNTVEVDAWENRVTNNLPLNLEEALTGPWRFVGTCIFSIEAIGPCGKVGGNPPDGWVNVYGYDNAHWEGNIIYEMLPDETTDGEWIWSDDVGWWVWTGEYTEQPTPDWSDPNGSMTYWQFKEGYLYCYEGLPTTATPIPIINSFTVTPDSVTGPNTALTINWNITSPYLTKLNIECYWRSENVFPPTTFIWTAASIENPSNSGSYTIPASEVWGLYNYYWNTEKWGSFRIVVEACKPEEPLTEYYTKTWAHSDTIKIELER